MALLISRVDFIHCRQNSKEMLTNIRSRAIPVILIILFAFTTFGFFVAVYGMKLKADVGMPQTLKAFL